MSEAESSRFLEAGGASPHAGESGLFATVGHGIESVALAVGVAVVLGWLLARGLRRAGLAWTWALLGLPVGYLAGGLLVGRWPIWIVSLIAAVKGSRLHDADMAAGGESAQIARSREGVSALLGSLNLPGLNNRRREARISNGRLTVGRTSRTARARIPVGVQVGMPHPRRGRDRLGQDRYPGLDPRTAHRRRPRRHVIDPKGDQLLRDEAESRPRPAGLRRMDAGGPTRLQPLRAGAASEIADKALAGETFTEPHYQRLAQRYLGHAIRTMQAAEVPVTPVSLMEHLDPGRLDATARKLPDSEAEGVQGYLDGLADRQKRDLAGVRDRLSILAESETGPWLSPINGTALDLAAVTSKAVVYFRLDADRRTLLSKMIAAAIISDLITMSAHLQQRPVPTVVLIDEFASIAAEHTGRLFGKARTAGISLILGTQELADLHAAGEALHDQVLGNLEALIAHRQNIPASAELIADVAGTQEVWIPDRTDRGRLARHPPLREGQPPARRGVPHPPQPDQGAT